MTTTHKAYCGGYGAYGALGTGNEESSPVPPRLEQVGSARRPR